MPNIPPVSGRFKKGQSGNPEGRPKKSKANHPSAFEIVLNKKFVVTQNGVPRELTTDEALQWRTYEAALGGNRMAQREILRMIGEREKVRAAKRKVSSLRVEQRFEPVDPRNADEALCILGIATADEGRHDWGDERQGLLLEPWAVQAALSRRRGGKRLEARELNEIERCTRGAKNLRWPQDTE